MGEGSGSGVDEGGEDVREGEGVWGSGSGRRDEEEVVIVVGDEAVW